MAKKLFDEQLNIFNRHSQADIIIKESGKVELISDKACELLGLPRDQIVSKNISAIIPSWDSIPLPSTKWNEVENIEVEITNSPNSGLYLLNAKALRKSSGKIDEIVCTLRSIKQVLNEANKYIGNKAVFTFDDLVGISTPMKKILKEAKLFALGNSPIMILGEKFTGKKILAEAIHNHSNRHDYGFVKVDLSNLTPDEMDETLWGFTNNHKPYLERISKPGAFEFADGGTIYIKEIGQMPISLQKKLLKTLSTGSVTRLGSSLSTRVDVKVITSNSVDLTTQIEKGEFLLDLFYSLSTASLRVPQLRERKADIPSLLNYFMQIKSLEIGKTPPEIPKKFVFLLKRYEWPMNFKEMREFVEILFNDQGKMFKDFKNERDFKQKHLYLDHLKELDSIVPLDEVEMYHVIKAYRAFNGSISKASRRLGVSRNTLYLKLKKIWD
jgi:transcriptional regulator with PAS, ATPase and Fis domain